MKQLVKLAVFIIVMAYTIITWILHLVWNPVRNIKLLVQMFRRSRPLYIGYLCIMDNYSAVVENISETIHNIKNNPGGGYP
jgi:hypothetical protein